MCIGVSDFFSPLYIWINPEELVTIRIKSAAKNRNRMIFQDGFHFLMNVSKTIEIMRPMRPQVMVG